jgi:Uma2 family endonuclease
MGLSLKREEYYTYKDWLSWDEDFRAELIDGQIVMMAPPSRTHQKVSVELVRQLANFLKGKSCQVFHAPFGVRLSKTEDTVFEPDIVVVCDKSKLNKKFCDGAPDFVIEILSPSTARYDRFIKLLKYQRAGVREYWIVDPDTKSVNVFMLENKKYVVSAYGDDDVVPVTVLEGCEIALADVFGE